jgi:hypothetical protein
VPEVRAAALYALSKFIGTDKEADEGGEGKDSRGETREGDGNSGEGKDGGGGRASAGARANTLREQVKFLGTNRYKMASIFGPELPCLAQPVVFHVAHFIEPDWFPTFQTPLGSNIFHLWTHTRALISPLGVDFPSWCAPQDVKARIDVELDLAMNALACLSDGSVVVRRELVLFLASLVRRFEDGMVRAGVRAGWGVGPLRQWDTLSANLQVPILLEEVRNCFDSFNSTRFDQSTVRYLTGLQCKLSDKVAMDWPQMPHPKH